MYLENIPKRKDRKKKAKRLGRGYGSGVGGHTVGRGMKGQKSRAGHKSLVAFEGGNVPFYKRMPKYKGFKSLSKINTQVINVDTLSKNFRKGSKVTAESLKEKGLVRKGAKDIKILGRGEIDKKLIIEDLKTSPVASEKILKAGGEVK
jgi:large subunit ribosomal protein L15